MITGREEIILPIGGRFKKIYDFLDSLGSPEDFAGRTATLTIKNIAEEYEDEAVIETIGSVTVEPLDSESNTIKGRLVIDIDPSYTSQIKIPNSETDPYIKSGRYAVITVRFDNDEIPLLLTVKPIKTF
jgi:hypothetical protein